MDELARKRLIQQTFNTVANGYDRTTLRFFDSSAEALAQCLELAGHEHILDVATGTGKVAAMLAQRLPAGEVTGIDFSREMLAQAKANAAHLALKNVRFVEMDMQRLDDLDCLYHTATCAFGIFFVENMQSQLAHIASRVRPGGQVALSSFSESAFQPLVELFFERIQRYGIALPPLSWKRIATAPSLIELLCSVGLTNTRVIEHDAGYYLADADEWWEVIWHAGFRSLVSQLAPDDLERFREEHLAEVAGLAGTQGIRLEVPVLLGIGETPRG